MTTALRKTARAILRPTRNALSRLGISNDELMAAQKTQLATINMRLDRMLEAHNNQSTAINERLDRLNKEFEIQYNQSTAILEAHNNQSTAINERLDRISKEFEDQSTSTLPSQPPTREAAASLSTNIVPETNASPILRPLASACALPEFSPKSDGNGETKPAMSIPTNELEHYHQLFTRDLTPWKGEVPKGFLVDFLGILTDGNFRTQYGINPSAIGGEYQQTVFPKIGEENAEWWFETVNWFEAAREARGHYVMITLGACYGAQAVGAYRALQIVNPMPCKLVAVEPVPANYQWVRKHFQDNGINPDDHWLLPTAISDRNDPVLFPVGAPGSGANNCVSTNEPKERAILAEEIIRSGKAEDTLRALLTENSTKQIKNLIPGQDTLAEIKYVSAVTLRDILSPFDVVDYVEADMQQSEIIVFPPFMDLLKKKVRRIHIGTHGAENHRMLHKLFAKNGWHIVFSYEPDATHDSPLGPIEMNDGVLTVRNPTV